MLSLGGVDREWERVLVNEILKMLWKLHRKSNYRILETREGSVIFIIDWYLFKNLTLSC